VSPLITQDQIQSEKKDADSLLSSADIDDLGTKSIPMTKKLKKKPEPSYLR
jgi:hypothetical protein